MKVAVNKIGYEGFVEEEDIEASLWDMDSPDVKFIGKIHLECEFKAIKNGIVVNARVTTHKDIRCSRCLEVVQKEEVDRFEFFFERRQLSEFLEIDDSIREELLLKWPMKFLCKEDCRGICPGCGMNLNIEECICKRF